MVIALLKSSRQPCQGTHGSMSTDLMVSRFLGAGSRLLRVFVHRASRDEQEQPACDFRMSLMIKSNYTNVSTVNVEPQTLRNHEKNT